MMEEKSLVEKVSGSPGPPLLLAASLLPVLGRIPAAERFVKRVENAFKDLEEWLRDHDAAMQNITDGQYEFILATVDTLFATVDERKIELLKTAIKNGVREPFDHYEAQWVAKILRSISVEEAQFLISSLQYREIIIHNKPIRPLTIKHDSEERLLVAGLVTIGVLTQSDTIAFNVNSYQWSRIATKAAAILQE